MKTWLGVALVVALSTGLFAEEGWPREFTDAAGHKVVLAAKPARIASLTLGTDENLLDLVEPSRIVAMTALSKDPYISNVADRVPEGMLLIKDKDEWKKVVDAKPDLVLVATYTKEFVKPLVDAGLPVYQFSEFNSIEALFKNFETLGRLTGEEAKAEQVLVECRKRLSTASEWRPETPVRGLYYSEGKIFTAGTTAGDLLKIVGVIDVAAEFGLTGMVNVTPKLLANLKPEVIFIGEDSKEAEVETLKLLSSGEYAGVPAVKAGRLHAVPGRHATTVSWNIVRAVEDMQKVLR